LAHEHRTGLAAAAGALRRALPPHVALLPGRLDGLVPQPPAAAVAAGALAWRGAGRLRGAALSGASAGGPRRCARAAHGAWCWRLPPRRSVGGATGWRGRRAGIGVA